MLRGRNIVFAYYLTVLRSVPYDRLSSLTRSMVWCDAGKYEARHRSGVEETYFSGLHSRDFLMILRKEQVRSYAKASSWRRKYEPFWALLVSTSPLFWYLPGSIINNWPYQLPLYRDARADHCVKIITLVLQRVNLMEGFV